MRRDLEEVVARRTSGAFTALASQVFYFGGGGAFFYGLDGVFAAGLRGVHFRVGEDFAVARFYLPVVGLIIVIIVFLDCKVYHFWYSY